jgi:uncharacterized protein (TIGR02246 family)
MFRPYVSGVPSPSPFPDTESRVRDLTQDFCTAFNTANYDHVAKFFTPDGFFMPQGAEPVQGSRAIERKFREFGENGYQNLRLETTRIDSAGDMAIEIGRYTLAIRRANGAIAHDSGKYMRVWRRLGAWLIVADCWSSNLARIEDQPANAKEISRAGNKPMVIGEDVPKSA